MGTFKIQIVPLNQEATGSYQPNPVKTTEMPTAELFATPAQHSQHATLTQLMATVDREQARGDDVALGPVPSPMTLADAYQQALVRAHDSDFTVATSRIVPRDVHKRPIIFVRAIARASEEDMKGGREKRGNTTEVTRTDVRLDQIRRQAEIIEFVLQRERSAGIPSTPAPFERKTKIPFEEHIGCYMQLLQDFRKASGPNTRQIAACRLSTYVYTTCASKMLERIRHGSSQNDLFAVLGRKPEDIPDSAWYAPIPENLAMFANRRSRPNYVQAAWLKAFYGDDEQILRQIPRSPVYGIDGRRRLQTCLSKCLLGLAEALLNIEKYSDTRYQTHDDHHTSTIRSLVMLVRERMTLLTQFLYAFNPIADSHFRWLQRFWAPGQGQEQIRILGSNSKDPEEYPEFLRLQRYQKHPHHHMHQYLQLICQHQLSLDRLIYLGSLKKDACQLFQESQYILHADVHVVDVYYYQEESPKGFAECLKALFDKTLNAGLLTCLTGRDLAQNGSKKSIMHPTTALGALLACFRCDEFANTMAQEVLRETLSISASTVALFKGMEVYVRTSQMQCLSCCFMLSAVRVRGRHAANIDTKWQPCLLPNFLPGQIARVCMKAFEISACKRLRQVLDSTTSLNTEGSEEVQKTTRRNAFDATRDMEAANGWSSLSTASTPDPTDRAEI